MLTSKQKRYLKGLANPIKNRYLLGKEEPDEAFLDELDKALEAKELIKVGLLQSQSASPEEMGKSLAERLGAELVQTIGRVIVLYRPSKAMKKIVLPED